MTSVVDGRVCAVICVCVLCGRVSFCVCVCFVLVLDVFASTVFVSCAFVFCVSVWFALVRRACVLCLFALNLRVCESSPLCSSIMFVIAFARVSVLMLLLVVVFWGFVGSKLSRRLIS